eukprot:scaffold5314_cov91-Isochrysis_galbana.AAC.1
MDVVVGDDCVALFCAPHARDAVVAPTQHQRTGRVQQHAPHAPVRTAERVRRLGGVRVVQTDASVVAARGDEGQAGVEGDASTAGRVHA